VYGDGRALDAGGERWRIANGIDGEFELHAALPDSQRYWHKAQKLTRSGSVFVDVCRCINELLPPANLSFLGAGLTFPSVTAFSPNLSKYGQSGAFTLGEIHLPFGFY
jgi:hypothetical protein